MLLKRVLVVISVQAKTGETQTDQHQDTNFKNI